MKMTYEEAQNKARKVLVKDYTYNLAQSQMMKEEIIGKTFKTKAGKVVEVVEHTDNNNVIIKIGNEYDAVAGVWFIAHVERGSFSPVTTI
jgi:hypothetical protein